MDDIIKKIKKISHRQNGRKYLQNTPLIKELSQNIQRISKIQYLKIITLNNGQKIWADPWPKKVYRCKISLSKMIKTSNQWIENKNSNEILLYTHQNGWNPKKSFNMKHYRRGRAKEMFIATDSRWGRCILTKLNTVPPYNELIIFLNIYLINWKLMSTPKFSY